MKAPQCPECGQGEILFRVGRVYRDDDGWKIRLYGMCGICRYEWHEILALCARWDDVRTEVLDVS